MPVLGDTNAPHRPFSVAWKQQNMSLYSTYFVDAHNGWAVGDGGTILATRNGGANWQPQFSGTSQNLNGVYFADARTGWAVGAGGIILATRNGGANWQLQTSSTRSDLSRIHFGDARTGWAVGAQGVRVRAGPATYAPWIDQHETTVKSSLGGQVELSFLVHAGSSQPVLRANVEYKAKQKPWESLEETLERPDLDGRWRIKWSPAEFGLATDQIIEYRVRIDDGRPPLAPFELGSFRYQPWWATVWQHYRKPILGFSGALSLLAAYSAVLGIMLWLAGNVDAFDMKEGKKTEGTLGVLIKLLQRAIQAVVLPWFVCHARVRREWTRLYIDGKVKIEQLSKRARKSFLDEPDFLDAWVSSRIKRVSQALKKLELFEKRPVYVALPVRVNDAQTGRMIDQPNAQALGQFFAPPRAILSIVGDGGSGKSTLACALARWVMASEAEERLASHKMLPVFIVEDTTNLLDSTARILRRMLGEEELPDDLLRSLLAKQRLLIVVDALSEREPATQRHIEKLYDLGWPINALVVTSRREPDLMAVDRTTLEPEHLTGERVIPFIFEYLRRRGLENLFSGSQQVRLGERVLALAESGGQSTSVTPLLVTLFIESALSRIRAGTDLASMPDQIPEVFLDYLRRLNPTTGDPATVVPNEQLIPATCCLAIVSLGNNFIPGDFQQEDGLRTIATGAICTPIGKVIERLIANGVLERREFAGIPLLRFSLDPAAEYLAAIGQIKRLQSNRDDWERFVVRLQSVRGYPTECHGFLIALSTCYRAYQVPLKLPLGKSMLETRPSTTNEDETIQGHVFCSFLGLLLKQELESRMKRTRMNWEWKEAVMPISCCND
jgi:hypothetical protein